MPIVNDPKVSKESLYKYFYRDNEKYLNQKFADPKIEAVSFNETKFVSVSFRNALIDAAELAFNHHIPIKIRPDNFWLIIIQGFSRHIKENSEKYRNIFVNHPDKLLLTVERHEFIKGKQNNWVGVFEEFSQQIKSHIGINHDLFVRNYSTSTSIDHSCFQIGLMDAMSAYFEYRVMTLCGIPSFDIQGSKEDWVSLQTNFMSLTDLFKDDELILTWKNKLLPILNNIIESFNKSDIYFWRNFYKENSMSGTSSITGWIRHLFLYLKNFPNKFDDEPIELSDFPMDISKVPFLWNYYGTEIKMEFLGGHIGAIEENGFLTPMMGWMVKEI